MGGKGSKTSANGIQYDQWERGEQINDYTVMKSSKGNGEAELHSIITQPRFGTDKQMQIYSYRKNQDNALVKCIGAELNKGKKTTMCGNQNQFKVLTERIPRRWNELPNVTFPESVYALSEALVGYEDLHSKVGPFDVTPTMMGINNQGEMKVWLNQDFAQNHPSHERPLLQTTSMSVDQINIPSSETSMVQNIIEIIGSKTEDGKFPLQFKQFVGRNSKTFQAALNSVQDYTHKADLFVPQNLNISYINAPQQKYPSQFNNQSYIRNAYGDTNRFTYNQQNSQKQSDNSHYARQTKQPYRNTQIQNDYERPYTFQQNPVKVQQNYPYANSYGVDSHQKRFTYGQERNTIEPRNIIQYTGTQRYTTYGHGTKQYVSNNESNNQPLQTSQITKHY